MKLLAIDTATEACSAALYLDNEITERFSIEPRRHAELILPMVESLLSEAGISLKQLDALAVDRGPGSFTGVRICNGVVQGLAFAADLPVLPISSLAALAQHAYQLAGHTRVLAMLDARMQEVYWAGYRLVGEIMCLQGTERVGAIEAVSSDLMEQHVVVGSALAAYPESLQRWRTDRQEILQLPRASFIAQLALTADLQQDAVAAEQLEPVYLRNQVVQTSGK